MFDNPTKHHHAKSSLPADPTLPVQAIGSYWSTRGWSTGGDRHRSTVSRTDRSAQQTRVVARSCADPDYRALLRDDVSAATWARFSGYGTTRTKAAP